MISFFDYEDKMDALSVLDKEQLIEFCINARRHATDVVAYAGSLGNWEFLNKLYCAIWGKPPFPESWKTRDTVSIAKDMLASRNLKDMPILADALEDAGCQDHEILYHLRNDKDLWCPGDWVLVNLGE